MEREFSISGPTICGSAEAEQRVFNMYVGKSGRRWLVADQENAGENIYVEGGPNSDGFGGRTLEFQLKDGAIISLKGPWHSNCDSLFNDTGVDVRNQYYTFGIISLGKRYTENYLSEIFEDVLFYDESPVLGDFNRIENLAKEFAYKLNRRVYYAQRTRGGGSSQWIDPK